MTGRDNMIWQDILKRQNFPFSELKAILVKQLNDLPINKKVTAEEIYKDFPKYYLKIHNKPSGPFTQWYKNLGQEWIRVYFARIARKLSNMEVSDISKKVVVKRIE